MDDSGTAPDGVAKSAASGDAVDIAAPAEAMGDAPAVRRYVFRGDDNYRGGAIGRKLGAEADAKVVAMQVQSSLVASGNTYNPSLLVLRQKGYELWLERGGNASLWCARKGDRTFLAYTGPELLGLVVLWEQLGENWNQQTPDIYSELVEKMED